MLKHWQLFSLVVGLPVSLQIVCLLISWAAAPRFIFPYMFATSMIVSMIVFWGWFYVLGTNLYKKLPFKAGMNPGLFKLFLVIPVLYMLTILAVIGFIGDPVSAPFNPVFFLLAIPVHLFSIFCIFYCLYFNAKALKIVELRKAVVFNDFAGEFFLLWFFPIGIWILQPRINRIFERSSARQAGITPPV